MAGFTRFLFGLLLQRIDLLHGLLMSQGIVVDDLGRFFLALASAGGNDVDQGFFVSRVQRGLCGGLDALKPLFQCIASLGGIGRCGRGRLLAIGRRLIGLVLDVGRGPLRLAALL